MFKLQIHNIPPLYWTLFNNGFADVIIKVNTLSVSLTGGSSYRVEGNRGAGTRENMGGKREETDRDAGAMRGREAAEE